MSVDLSHTLIVAISATALFDLSASESYFEQAIKDDASTAVDKFRAYMIARENEPLATGTGYPLIKALLNLNHYQTAGENAAIVSPLVEVVIMSKNSPDTGIQVLNALRSHGLPISRSAFTSGEGIADYVADFNVDLFLTTNHADAQKVTDTGVCACAILDAPPINMRELDTDQLRIAFDGDAVLFDEAGELLSQRQGLQAFHDYEAKFSDVPMQKGPYADFLIKLSKLQQRLPSKIQHPPIQIALVTARNAPADLRAIKTLRNWGVSVDLAFFLGGLEKTRVLQTFAPHIFFDDSLKNYNAAKSFVPSGLVPYRSKSALFSEHLIPNQAAIYEINPTTARENIESLPIEARRNELGLKNINLAKSDLTPIAPTALPVTNLPKSPENSTTKNKVPDVAHTQNSLKTHDLIQPGNNFASGKMKIAAILPTVKIIKPIPDTEGIVEDKNNVLPPTSPNTRNDNEWQ